jgi:hypothetical protein
VSTTVRPTCMTSPCKVRVSLPGYPETIDFLLDLTGNQLPLAKPAALGPRHRHNGSRRRRAR